MHRSPAFFWFLFWKPFNPPLFPHFLLYPGILLKGYFETLTILSLNPPLPPPPPLGRPFFWALGSVRPWTTHSLPFIVFSNWPPSSKDSHSKVLPFPPRSCSPWGYYVCIYPFPSDPYELTFYILLFTAKSSVCRSFSPPYDPILTAFEPIPSPSMNPVSLLHYQLLTVDPPLSNTHFFLPFKSPTSSPVVLRPPHAPSFPVVD